jgi:DNA polymerase I-like protein with 3'-5' exonuclease and polymerase domains
MFDMITIDFETEGITVNPTYCAPKAVGVSIKYGAGPSKYYAWGHPTGNNCTYAEGSTALREALYRAVQWGCGWLAQNAGYEAAILAQQFGIVAPDPLLVHDTQYVLFLTEPYAHTYSLKPSAERVLGIPPDEQEAVRDWLLQRQPMLDKGITLTTSKEETDSRHFWARYICLAPGDLVGKYAEGDTDRTYAIWALLYPQVIEQGMLPAYQREQKLLPILSEASAQGILLDEELLYADVKKYRLAQKASDEYIFSRLGEFDLAKDAELAAALDRKGQVTEWVLTATGRRSVARKNLVGRVKDPLILMHLAYRGVLETCLGTFALPWLEQASQEGGRLHPQWNQVRGNRGEDGDISGTRTGRMSCRKPNMQNPPNDFEDLVVPPGQPPIMQMRRYLLPDKGHVWLKRDFSAQEMRIMAHYTEGKLAEAFRADPKTDPHVMVQGLIREVTGLDLVRKHVKITGFGIMYGRGVPNLATALGVTPATASETREAYYTALPEVRELSKATRRRGSGGGFITTWGGRRYYREPNLERDFSYKLLNYLIQGSGADQSKEAVVHWGSLRKPGDKLQAVVHDEINISVPLEEKVGGMVRLKTAMDWPRFDVPFMSEGYSGPNWADLVKEEQ